MKKKINMCSSCVFLMTALLTSLKVITRTMDCLAHIFHPSQGRSLRLRMSVERWKSLLDFKSLNGGRNRAWQFHYLNCTGGTGEWSVCVTRCLMPACFSSTFRLKAITELNQTKCPFLSIVIKRANKQRQTKPSNNVCSRRDHPHQPRGIYTMWSPWRDTHLEVRLSPSDSRDTIPSSREHP